MPIAVIRTDEYHTGDKTYDKYMTDEVTLSHLLREPSELIPSGLSYGGHLAKILSERESFPERPVILEIGAGLGHLGEEMFHYLGRQGIETRYAILDICHNLLTGIRECKDDDFEPLLIRGDGTKLPFNKEGAFNVIICNEAVGDFVNIILDKGFNSKFQSKHPVHEKDIEIYRDSIRMIRNYGIDLNDAPDEFIFNYGALRLVEELGRIKPAVAFICENAPKGKKYPKKLALKSHTECEVNFSHLEKVSSYLGFKAETGEISELLGIDCDTRVLDHFFIDDFLRYIHKNDAISREKKALAMKDVLDSIWYKAVTPEELRKRMREAGFDYNDQDFKNFFVKENCLKMGDLTSDVRYIILQYDRNPSGPNNLNTRHNVMP
jgi:hypothetical protein